MAESLIFYSRLRRAIFEHDVYVKQTLKFSSHDLSRGHHEAQPDKSKRHANMSLSIVQVAARLVCLVALLHFDQSLAFVVARRISHPSARSLTASPHSQDNEVIVALTREAGKNDKIRKVLLEQRPLLRPVEVPCIAHADGPDYDRLADTLRQQHWDYVAVTSPEAARVLCSAWSECDFANNNKPAVTAVGKATEAALELAGIDVAFVPSKATAKTLVAELPISDDPLSAPPRVLYPASARAKKTLQDGLMKRGFDVTRLDTYDTVTAVWNDEEQRAAHQARIACFASPSAVTGWLHNSNGRRVLAACIGETSAQACRENGWGEADIFYPQDNPGMEGWLQAITQASETVSRQCAEKL